MNPLTPTTTMRLTSALLAVGLIAGCSSGGSDFDAGPSPMAQAPQISGLTAVQTNQDTTSSPLAFQIQDADTPQDLLTVSVVSSVPNLLPPAGVLIEGAGSVRSLRVTPAPEAFGDAIITITVRDPSGLQATASVAVRINPVYASFKALTDESFVMAEDGTQTTLFGITVTPDADDDDSAFDAHVQ
jgi:hypothetical protein